MTSGFFLFAPAVAIFTGAALRLVVLGLLALAYIDEPREQERTLRTLAALTRPR